MSDGGPFVLSIFSAGVLMWALILERYYFFWRILPKQIATAQAQWQARRDRTSWCARQIRTAMISRLNGSMTTGFPVMQVLVPMSPLLGLIGTVSGMLDRVRLDGAARQRGRAQHGERRLGRDDLHDDRPRGQHHRLVSGSLLQGPSNAGNRVARR